MMNKLNEIIQRKPYLTWYIKNKKKLSKESVVEHVLNFGDWGDYLAVEKALGVANLREIFEQLRNSRRVNLRGRTINYFNHYFHKYA